MRHFVFLLVTLLLSTCCLLQGQTVAQWQQAIREAATDADRTDALLELASVYVLRPGAEKADMDSALLLLTRVRQLNQRMHSDACMAHCNMLYSAIYREEGEVQHNEALRLQGLPCAQAAVNWYKAHPQKDFEGYACLELSHYTFGETREKILGKIAVLEQAAAAFGRSGNQLLQARMLQSIGDNYMLIDANVPAMQALLQSIDLYHAVHFPETQQACLLVSAIYAARGDYVNALRYGLDAEHTAASLHDTTMQACMVYNYQGRTFLLMEQFETALGYFRKAQELAVHHHDTANLQVVLLNVAETYLEMDSARNSLAVADSIAQLHSPPVAKQLALENIRVRACLALHQPAQAQSGVAFLRSGEALASREQNSWSGPIYQALSAYYLATADYAQAYHYNRLWEGLNGHSAPCAYRKVWSEILLQRSRIDAGSGHLREAMQHYHDYVNLRDSLFNEKTARLINIQQIRHEAADKDLQLSLKNQQLQVLQRDEQLRHHELQHAGMLRNAVAVCILLILVALVLTASQVRLKQRHSRILQRQQADIQHRATALEHLRDEQYRLLQEKEWLMQEMHSRVKENLQLMTALMGEVFDETGQPQAFEAMRDGRQRVQAMALLHEQLYQAGGDALIDMKAYCEKLLASLQALLRPPAAVHFLVRTAPLHLPVQMAVPLGLIINEAVTNALKYAFAPGQGGAILVSLEMNDTQWLELCIRDDGKGLPPGFDLEQHAFFGWRLISTLAQQLEGTLTVTGKAGVWVRLVFPLHVF